MAADCRTCHGRLHVRVEMGTWRRCPDCFRKASSLAFIKPELRGGCDAVPAEIEALPPLPFGQASVIHPSDVFFRQWAWRSLLDYETRGVVYDYIDAARLIEVQFNRDSVYTTLYDVQQIPLLLIDLSATKRDHPYLASVFNEVVVVRQRCERPTWAYAPNVELVKRFFNEETLTYFNATRVLPGHTLPMVAAAATTLAPSKPTRYDPNSV